MHLSPMVTYITDCSKAVVLLFLIYCFMCLPFLWGFCVYLCFAVYYFVSFPVFAIILTKKRAVCIAFIVFRLFGYCKCSVARPQGAIGGSALCDCGIS